MIALGINDAKVIARCRKVIGNSIDNRVFGVFEINGDKSADGGSHLIHKSGGLAEINVLGMLSYLGDLDCAYLAFIVKVGENSSDKHLKCRRGGKSAALEHV